MLAWIGEDVSAIKVTSPVGVLSTVMAGIVGIIIILGVEALGGNEGLADT